MMVVLDAGAVPPFLSTRVGPLLVCVQAGQTRTLPLHTLYCYPGHNGLVRVCV